ncbi:hypothetical protein [Spirosoma utsteinense]|uniref:Glycosyltransferase RgtA/B/C/D-like domain-containing protein n=1 Tax=Spirosoma utsteinense TaxID=2585773 RepID=A0ABR6W1P9_9BACT|nr:hypothetical protein [Spirosoma utsteinense]MBC3785245.1 hypothetical protein [Spirosoma utsteinense]MBC3790529.1 hypothetical protein [Spirosoma utsteinense]
MTASVYLLRLGWGLTGIAVVALVWVNPTHFTSIDSGYYLQSASSLLAGRGYVITEDGQQVWNGVFPIGYSALIALFAGLTGLPVLWASKAVNLLAVSLSVVLWQRRLGTNRTLWILSIWWLGSFLRLLAYTWSETVFLVLLAEWVWSLNILLRTPARHRIVRLALLSIGLFLLRYIGGYIVGVLAFLALALYLTPHRVQSLLRVPIPPGTHKALARVAGLSVAAISTYGWLNLHHTDSLYGGERFLPTEPMSTLLRLFARSIGNELLLIRDFLPAVSNQLAWVGAGIQVLWLWLVSRRVHQQPIPWTHHPDLSFRSLNRLFILTGGLYIVVLFALRTVSPFSGPNARLMAPATFCFLMAFLLRVGNAHPVWQRKLRPFWIGLLLCSWLQLIPQGAKPAKIRLPDSWISALRGF